jgi:hypothetical protein
LTILEKADQKGFVMRARQSGDIKKGKKRRYALEEERFDRCYGDPVPEEE